MPHPTFRLAREVAALTVAVAMLATLGLATPAAAAVQPDDGSTLVGDRLAGDVTAEDLWGDTGDRAAMQRIAEASDIFVRPVPLSSQFAAAGTEFSGDPLGLAVYPLETRRYTEGTDTMGVYLCDLPGAGAGLTMNGVIENLNGPVKQYFAGASKGEYKLSFKARKKVAVTAGEIEADSGAHIACIRKVYNSGPATGDNGAFVVLDNTDNGGVATSGNYCALPCTSSTSPMRFPSNDRWGVVDGGSLGPQGHTSQPHLTTAVHEIGHMIGWPHSNSGLSNDEYDNPLDVMSGNLPADFGFREDDPYATVAWNRYRAGWIEPGQVLIYRGGVRKVKIAPVGKPGIQMVVMPTSNKYAFATLDARRNVGVDKHLPNSFQGVTTHYIQQLGFCASEGPDVCWGLQSNIFSYPPAADNLRHVTKPGQSKRMDLGLGYPMIADGAKVTVISGNDSGYTIRLVGFSDIGSSVFLDDIIWLAERGITKGCTSIAYCPGDTVTRGQMAAFLTRALNLPKVGDQGFTDTAGNVFKADIDALAKAGVTKGCNPPANNRFCPNDPVTRGQMAAFLTRAFNLPAAGNQGFTDIGGSVFVQDINSLAKSGITKGCNPPSNNRFCPTDLVTRGQMAAFLERSAPHLP